MKKKIFFVLSVMFLLVLLAFNALSTYAGIPDEGTSTEYYYRHDILCPSQLKEKTFCEAGGNELCSPRYCD